MEHNTDTGATTFFFQTGGASAITSTSSVTPTPSEPRTLTSNGRNYALNGKIMLSSVLILFVAVAIMVCFHSYGRWLYGRRRRQVSNRRPALLPVAAGASSGLSLSILKALPTFVYLEVGDAKACVADRSSTAPECSVCLSEFEDKEEGRELPKCKHIFHLECIDMWFGSHSTCPLCRAPVELELGHEADTRAGRGPSKCEARGSSSGSGELVGVLVEVPPVAGEEMERSRRSLVDLGLGLGLGPGSSVRPSSTPKSARQR